MMPIDSKAYLYVEDVGRINLLATPDFREYIPIPLPDKRKEYKKMVFNPEYVSIDVQDSKETRKLLEKRSNEMRFEIVHR